MKLAIDNKYGWEGIAHIKARVKIRDTNPHSGNPKRPNCWMIDGRVFDFTFCWYMEDHDPYPGEVAWSAMPKHRGGIWPDDAPGWIASGDLEILEEW